MPKRWSTSARSWCSSATTSSSPSGTARPRRCHDVRKLLEANPDRLQWGPASILYAIADKVVDDYVAVMRGLDNDIDQIEHDVFSGPKPTHAERIFKLKREVLDFRRAVDPLEPPLAELAAGIKPVDERSVDYFRDVHDHLLRVSEHLAGLDALLDSALNANVAQVGMRQNEDMRKISAWVAIVAVPTMIAGIYGMNFEHMPELGVADRLPADARHHGAGLLRSVPQLQAARLAVDRRDDDHHPGSWWYGDPAILERERRADLRPPVAVRGPHRAAVRPRVTTWRPTCAAGRFSWSRPATTAPFGRSTTCAGIVVVRSSTTAPGVRRLARVPVPRLVVRPRRGAAGCPRLRCGRRTSRPVPDPRRGVARVGLRQPRRRRPSAGRRPRRLRRPMCRVSHGGVHGGP